LLLVGRQQRHAHVGQTRQQQLSQTVAGRSFARRRPQAAHARRGLPQVAVAPDEEPQHAAARDQKHQQADPTLVQHHVPPIFNFQFSIFNFFFNFQLCVFALLKIDN